MPETVEELKERIKDLEKSNSFLESKLRLFELPSSNRAFYVGQKMLNQQVDYLDKFNLSKEIGTSPKDDKIYDRAIDLFEKLSVNASKLNNLRIELSLTGDEKKDSMKKPFVDSIAEKRY